MAQPTVYDALAATLSTDRSQRDGALAFMKNLEDTNTSYREILAHELFDESKPVCAGVLFIDLTAALAGVD